MNAASRARPGERSSGAQGDLHAGGTALFPIARVLTLWDKWRHAGMRTKAYWLSLPERIARSVLGLGAGVTRELSDVALPAAVRRSQLYQNVVDATLRYLIEQVGGVESADLARPAPPDDFLVRRTAGNAVEMLGIVAFRASPVWVLAALADVCGFGRQLIPEIAEALKAADLLDKDAQFVSIDDVLIGLERTSARLAATVNTPPLDVAGLRREWEALRDEARGLSAAALPSREATVQMWHRVRTEAARHDRSVFEMSSMMALAAVQSLPDGVRWLSASARIGASRTGQFVAAPLLEHYTRTLSDMRDVGYLSFARRQLHPYIRAAAQQFSPQRRTFTDRVVDKFCSMT